MKRIPEILFISAICTMLISCKEPPQKAPQKIFDADKALFLFYHELEENSDFIDKPRLLIDLKSIIAKDTFYFNERREVAKYNPIFDNRKKVLYKLLKAKDYNKTDSLEAYRLSIDRSFNRETIFITIENTKNDIRLKIQGFSINLNCIQQLVFCDSCIQITRNLEKNLSKNDWSNFMKIIEENEFWPMIYTDNRSVIDGSSWHIEGLKPSYIGSPQYKILERCSPEKYSSVYKIGKYLLDLSKENWGDIY